MTTHSPTAQAFLRVIVDATRRLTPSQRALSVVVCRSGERPTVEPRSRLAGHLRANGLDAVAQHIVTRRTARHEQLVWLETDEATFAVVVPVAKGPSPVCELPSDDVLASLIG